MGVPVNGIFEVSIRSRLHQQRVLNVLHYQVETASAITNPVVEAERVANLFISAPTNNVITEYLRATSVDFAIEDVRAQAIDPVRHRFATVSVQQFGINLGAATEMQNVSTVLTKQADRAGRHFVGSFHMAGMPRTAVVGGIVSVAYRTTFMDPLALAVKSALVDTISGGEYVPVIYHRGTLPGLVASEITQMVPQTTWRTMRRRTVGLGE